MASINKLSIRGVRAFNPEDDEQVVEFYFPVTIIVGANGCGKTSVIESLKYAITGSFPPGSQSGKAFIHDAKSIGQQVVKASVKLRFKSKANQTMVVVRSMELAQKKATATFKQLDGVLRMRDPQTDERVSLSHKCSELDRHLPSLLGVSKPILEHVVFCHQEDSSWPLQEGAVLKKKFDEIFDSTKYSKALKVFRDTEKEFVNKVKEIKIELAELGAHKHAAEGIRKELQEQTEALESVEDMKKEYEKRIEKVEKKIEGLSGIIFQGQEIMIEIEACNNDLTQFAVLIQKQRSMLEEDLTRKYDLQQIKDMLRNFDEKVAAQLERKEELEASYRQLISSMENERKEEMTLTSKFGKVQAEKEAHEKRLRDRYRLMERMAQSYSMDLTQLSQSQNIDASFVASLSQSMMAPDDATQDDLSLISITPEDMQGFFCALGEKEAKLKKDLETLRYNFQNDEDKLTVSLTEYGGNLQAIENDRARLARDKDDAERELRELISKAADQPRVRRNDVEELRRRVKKLSDERDELNNDPRNREIPIEIRQLEEKIDSLKRKIEDETITFNNLRSTADAQVLLASLREQCTNEIEALQEAVHEEAYSFQKFNISIVTDLPMEGDNVADDIVDAIKRMENDVKKRCETTTDDLDVAETERVNAQKVVSDKLADMQALQKTLASHRSKLQSLAKSSSIIKNAVQELREHELALGTSIPFNEDSPREMLEFIEERQESIEEDFLDPTEAKIARKVLKSLRKKAIVKDPGEVVGRLECPCCKRSMDEEVAQKFESTMKSMAENSELVIGDPATQEKYQKSKVFYQNIRTKVGKEIDNHQEFRRLTDEVAVLEKELKRCSGEVLQLQTILKDKSEAKDDLQKEFDELRNLCEITRRWVDDANRISQKKMDIKQKQSDLRVSVAESSRDFRTVERSIADLKEKKETLTNRIFRLNKEMTNLNMATANKSAQVAQHEKLVREKEERYAAELKASERKKELQTRIQEIGEEEKKIIDQIAPLQSKIKKKEVEKQKLRALRMEEEQKIIKNLSLFDGDVQALRNLEKQIELYVQSSREEESIKISAAIKQTLARIEALKQEMKNLQPQLDAAREAVNDQERHKKQLKDNIDILATEEKMKATEKEKRKLEEKLDLLEGFKDAQSEYNKAKSEKDQFQNSKSICEGRFSSLVEQIRAMKRKLSSEEYKNVEERHRVAMIKHVTTKTAAEDLKKYGNALDKALLQFHGVKIREINKIIRDLWMMTYKGEDITNIEIVSGQEPGSKAAKSYNYRVVMTKGNSKLDMRGRCSAGQRVLASIVIRLALAEVFGLNFGALALDEPTVNLDFNNKKGLAIALAHIVGSRAQQQNFQLILITHDEEFTSMMKTELSALTNFSMPDKYFQLRREEAPDGKYYSKIHAVDWDELG